MKYFKFLIVLLFPLLMAASVKHSTVETKSRIMSDGTVLLQFKTVANKGYKLKFNSEWNLNLKKYDNIVFDKVSFDQDNLKNDKKSNLFLILLGKKTNMATSGIVEYELTSYVCKTKNLCYKDIHKGYIPWKALK